MNGSTEGKTPLFRLGDLLWGAWRALRWTMVMGASVSGHMQYARLRGWISSRRVPASVRENLAAVIGIDWEESRLNEVARQFMRYRSCLSLNRILPVCRNFGQSNRWKIVGGGHLDDALGRGKGVFLASGHLGYFGLIAPILRMHGYPVRAIKAQISAEDPVAVARKRAGWSRLRRKLNERMQIKAPVVTEHDIIAGLDARPIFDALKRKEAVLVMGDGLRSSRFVSVRLLGKPYPTAPGFMRIAMLGDVPILPVFAIPHGHVGVTLRIDPPLDIRRSNSLEHNLQLFMDVFEAQLHSTPHLWQRWGVPNWFTVVRSWAEKDPESRYACSVKEVDPQSLSGWQSRASDRSI